MVKLIVGNKGTGKTKALIDMTTKAAEKSDGNVVCIERGDALKLDLSHKIRLIDIDEYKIFGPDSYYGFIAGLLAGNYDITEIFADATFKIICKKDQKDYELMGNFLQNIEALIKGRDVNITFTISCAAESLPEKVQGMII